MRRLLSITLLVVFLFPIAAPLFALSTSDIPACCRKGGKHHCAMSAEDRAALDTFNNAAPQLAPTPDSCPFAPRSTAAHTANFALATNPATTAAITTARNRIAQTRSRQRLAQIRSHQKRGPPTRTA